MKTKIKNVANGAIFSCLSLLSAYGTHTYANNLLMDISDESSISLITSRWMRRN